LNRHVCIFVLSVPISSFSAFWNLENIFPAIVQLPNQTIFLIVSVFKNFYRDMMYEIWNASFCQDDKNKVAIVQFCLIQLLKESLVLFFFVDCFLISFWVFWWAENTISPHRSLTQYNDYSKYFLCLEDYFRDVMCRILCFSFALCV